MVQTTVNNEFWSGSSKKGFKLALQGISNTLFYKYGPKIDASHFVQENHQKSFLATATDSSSIKKVLVI